MLMTGGLVTVLSQSSTCKCSELCHYFLGKAKATAAVS